MLTTLASYYFTYSNNYIILKQLKAALNKQYEDKVADCFKVCSYVYLFINLFNNVLFNIEHLGALDITGHTIWFPTWMCFVVHLWCLRKLCEWRVTFGTMETCTFKILCAYFITGVCYQCNSVRIVHLCNVCQTFHCILLPRHAPDKTTGPKSFLIFLPCCTNQTKQLLAIKNILIVWRSIKSPHAVPHKMVQKECGCLKNSVLPWMWYLAAVNFHSH